MYSLPEYGLRTLQGVKTPLAHSLTQFLYFPFSHRGMGVSIILTCSTVRWEGHILLAVDEVHHWSHDGFQLSS